MIVEILVECFNIMIGLIVGSFVIHLIYLGWWAFAEKMYEANDQEITAFARVVVFLIRCIICRFLVFLFEVNLSWFAVILTFLLWGFWNPE